MKLSFIQHYHNGDLFTCKGFLDHIRHELPLADLEIFHFNHPKVLGDMYIAYRGHPTNFEPQTRFNLVNASHLYINTWAFCYGEYWKDGLNLDTLMGTWGHIFETINDKLGTDIKLKNKEFYIPSINFSHFDVSSIDKFLSEHIGKKVLICNGKAMSGQSFKSDMADVINALADSHPTTSFICTQKIDPKKSNIFFTDDIIVSDSVHMSNAPDWYKSGRCDLNEISYLSESCNLVVGKNSGPFIFCLTQTTLLDSKKTFISFNKRELDTFPLGADIKANYIYSNEYDNAYKIINENL